MASELEKFTAALTAIGCAFAIANGRVEVTSGFVYLSSLTTLPEGTTFSNGGFVDLRSLTTLPEGTTFSNGGSVDLSSLTTLPEGTTFSNGSSVYLRSLTTLPEGTTFSNGGFVYLRSIPDGKYTYCGAKISLAQVDGYTMLVRSKRQQGEHTILSCRYFGGGDLDKLKACYVVQAGEYNAHGETLAQALRDVRFKAAQADFDAKELVETIRARGTITFNDFRLLTGACESGLAHGLTEAGFAPDTEEMSLEAALKAAHGPYGAAFKALFPRVPA